jgi:tRNA-Thr(GGU) m(6)t(6)A37 methyltransferase TsaA
MSFEKLRGGYFMNLKQIGVIHSPWKAVGEPPFQGRQAKEETVIEIFPEYAAGLKDIHRASHLIVLYWCHLAGREKLQTVTPHGPETRGVFACRTPARPNPIAFCAAELLQINGNSLVVRGLDALDGSPLLDLKPYSSELDSITGVGIGWMNKS